MADEDFKRRLAELTTKLDVSRALVAADPFPYIEKMHRRMARLRATLDAVEYALSPDMVCDVAEELNVRPVDFQGEALVRCNKALEAIRKFHSEV